jgi:hypothetical protein
LANVGTGQAGKRCTARQAFTPAEFSRAASLLDINSSGKIAFEFADAGCHAGNQALTKLD